MEIATGSHGTTFTFSLQESEIHDGIDEIVTVDSDDVILRTGGIPIVFGSEDDLFSREDSDSADSIHESQEGILRPSLSVMFPERFDSGPTPPGAPGISLSTEVSRSLAQPGRRSYFEDQRGISHEKLFGPYFDFAKRIVIIDPGVHTFHQLRSLMELMQCVVRHMDVPGGEGLSCHLVTEPDSEDIWKQLYTLEQITTSLARFGLRFTFEITTDPSLYEQSMHIYIDDSWDISIDRGIDIFQEYTSENVLALEYRMPESRRVHAFEVVYKRAE